MMGGAALSRRPARHARSRYLAVLVALTVALVASTGWLRPAAATPAARVTRLAPRATGLTVVSVPNLLWADVDPLRTPALWTFLRDAAVGSLSLHSGNLDGPTEAEMYATLGAGTRAVVDRLDGDCRTEPGAVRCTSANSVVARNAAAHYGAEPFALGATLDAAGVARSVGGTCARGGPCALGLAGSGGSVPIAQRGRDGVHLIGLPDVAALDRFVRDDPVTAAASPVMIISPSYPGTAPALTVVALRAPGVAPGAYLSSPTTGRSGIVQMIDVAPTVLAQFGRSAPDSMEGRPFTVGAANAGGSLAARVEAMRTTNLDARLRDRMLGGGVAALAVLELAAVALYVFLAGLRKFLPERIGWADDRLDRAVELIALVALAYVPTSFLVNLLPLEHGGHRGFWTALFGITLALGIGTGLVAPKRGSAAALALVGLTFAILIVDGLTGTHLSFNALFGYSATAGGRFVGFGNSVFAFVATASAVLAGALALQRRWGLDGRLVGSLLNAFTLLVIGLPFFGADVGGAITMALATASFVIVVFALPMLSRRVALVAVGAVVFLGAITWFDASRPADEQTHLGRLVNSARDGSGEFSRVVHRKWDAAMQVTFHSVGTYVLPVALVLLVLLWAWAPRATRDRLRAHRCGRAVFFAVAVVTVVGSVVNDSGIAVAFAALAIAVPVVVFVASRMARGAWGAASSTP